MPGRSESAAWAAVTRTDQVTVAGHPDSRLHLIRDTYRAETNWAPQYPGERLRALRGAVIDTAATAARSDAEDENDDECPEIWITPPAREAAGQPAILAGWIAEATGSPFTAVLTAMAQSVPGQVGDALMAQAKTSAGA
jgi:hypothetical protein